MKIDNTLIVERKNSIAKRTEFGYNGEEHTLDGMQDLRARVYDPRTGVFLQQDSFGGNIDDPLSQNQYIYCLNNPLKYADPSGHKAMLNQDLGVSKSNTLSSKTTIRPFNPTASSVSVLPNKTGTPTVNTSRGSIVSQPTTSVPVSPIKSAEEEKAKLLKQKSEITQSLQRAQSGIDQMTVFKRELSKARLSESVSSLNAVEPEVEGSLYDRVQGSCQSSKQNEMPYYYYNPYGVEPIDVYYSSDGNRYDFSNIWKGISDIANSIGQDLVGRGIEHYVKNADELIDDAFIKWAARTGITYPTLSGPRMIVPMKPVFEKGKNLVSPLVNTLSKEGFTWGGKFGFSTVVGTIIGSAVDMGLNDKTWQEAVPETLIKTGITVGAFELIFSLNIPFIVSLGATYLVSKLVEQGYSDNVLGIKDIAEGMTDGLNYITNKTDEFIKWIGSIFDKTRIGEYEMYLGKIGVIILQGYINSLQIYLNIILTMKSFRKE